MNVYIALLILCSVSLFLHRNVIRKKIFRVIPYIAMAFVGGFRSEVGVDYLSYKEQFYDIVNKTGWYSNFEPGFKLLVRMISAVGGSYQVLFLVASCFTCFLYYKYISDNSKDFEISTMLFMCLGPFYLSSFNALRQSLAISIFLYALKYMKRKSRKYFLFILLASSIHTSAVVFLFFPLFRKLKRNYFFYLIGGFGTMYIVLRSNLIEHVLTVFFPGRLKLGNYAISMDKSYIAYLLICLFVLFFDDQLQLKIEKTYMYMMTYTCILIALAFLFPEYSMILTRFVSWGTPALIIIIPEFKKRIREEWVFNGAIYGVCIAYFLMLIRSSSAMLLPYNFNFILTN